MKQLNTSVDLLRAIGSCCTDVLLFFMSSGCPPCLFRCPYSFVLVHDLFLWCLPCPCSSTSDSVFLCDSSGLQCRSHHRSCTTVCGDVCGYVDCLYRQHSERKRVETDKLSPPNPAPKCSTCPFQFVVMSLFPSPGF